MGRQPADLRDQIIKFPSGQVYYLPLISATELLPASCGSWRSGRASTHGSHNHFAVAGPHSGQPPAPLFSAADEPVSSCSGPSGAASRTDDGDARSTGCGRRRKRSAARRGGHAAGAGRCQCRRAPCRRRCARCHRRIDRLTRRHGRGAVRARAALGADSH